MILHDAPATADATSAMVLMVDASVDAGDADVEAIVMPCRPCSSNPVASAAVTEASAVASTATALTAVVQQQWHQHHQQQQKQQKAQQLR